MKKTNESGIGKGKHESIANPLHCYSGAKTPTYSIISKTALPFEGNSWKDSFGCDGAASYLNRREKAAVLGIGNYADE